MSENLKEQELLFLLASYLKNSTLSNTFSTLCKEVEDIQNSTKVSLFPTKIDWEGNNHFQNYHQLESDLHYIKPNQLLDLASSYQKNLLLPNLPLNDSIGISDYINDGYTHHKKRNITNFLLGYQFGNYRKNAILQTKLIGSRIRKMLKFHGHICAVYCITFDLTGKRIITGGDDNIVKIWCAETGWLIKTIRAHQTLTRSSVQGVITDLKINRSNTVLATCSSDKTVRFWDMQTFEPIDYIYVGKIIVTINFSTTTVPSNDCLIVACNDGKVRVYKKDPTTGLHSRTPIVLSCGTYVKDKVTTCDFDITGTKFAAGGDDGILYLFSNLPENLISKSNSSEPVENPKLIRFFQSHIGRINDIEFSQTGMKIISGSRDGTFTVYTCDPKTREWTTFSVNVDEFAKKETPIFVEHIVEEEIDLPEVPRTVDLTNHQGAIINDNLVDDIFSLLNNDPVESVVADVSNTPIAGNVEQRPVLGPLDDAIERLLQSQPPLETQAEQNNSYLLNTPPQERTRTQDDQFTPNDLFAPDSPIQQTRRSSRIQTGIQESSRYNLRHQHNNNSDRYESDSQPLVSNYNLRNNGETNVLYDLYTNVGLHIPANEGTPSRNNRNNENTQSRQPRPNSTKPVDLVFTCWNANESCIITVTNDNIIRVWDSGTGDHRNSLHGHQDKVFAVHAHPVDPRLVVTGCYSGRIHLWDIETGVSVFSTKISERILSLTFDPEGHKFIAVDVLGVVHMYGIGLDNSAYVDTPTQQFHLIDWVMVKENADGSLVEEQSQIPAHRVENGPVVSYHRVPYAITDAQRWAKESQLDNSCRLIKIDLERRETAFREEEKHLLDILRQNGSLIDENQPVILDKKELMKRRKKFVDSDHDDDSGPVQQTFTDLLLNVPIPQPESSGDEYSGDEGEVSDEASDDDDSPTFSNQEGLPSVDPDDSYPRTRTSHRIGEHVVQEERDTVRDTPRRRNAVSNTTSKNRVAGRKRKRSAEHQLSDESSEGSYEIPEEEEDQIECKWDINQEDTDEELLEAGPSTRNYNKKKSKRVKANVTYIKESDDEEEAEPLGRYEIPEWISSYTPKISPYMPQMGDYIVYIKQGHSQFVKMTHQLYPSTVNEELPDMLLVRVIGIAYHRTPLVVCMLTLEMYPSLSIPENNIETTYPTTVLTYFDAPDVPEFLILWEEFRLSQERYFENGDTVFLRFSDGEYEGQIVDILDNSSPWEKYVVKYEEEDKPISLSPWEIRSKDATFAVLPKLSVQDTERLMIIFGRLLTDDELIDFIHPVDYKVVPKYLDIIAYPIYISLIMDRLKAGFYRQLDHVVWDFQQICENAFKFNAVNSYIWILAKKKLEPLIGKIEGHIDIDAPLKYDPNLDEIEKQLMQQPEPSALRSISRQVDKPTTVKPSRSKYFEVDEPYSESEEEVKEEDELDLPKTRSGRTIRSSTAKRSKSGYAGGNKRRRSRRGSKDVNYEENYIESSEFESE